MMYYSASGGNQFSPDKKSLEQQMRNINLGQINQDLQDETDGA